MKVKNKVIIVTGAGSGVGRQLSIELVKKEAKVIGVDLNHETLEETKNIISSESFKSYTLNVANLEDVTKFREKSLNFFGKVDGIINNAGIIQPFVNVEDITLEKSKQIMDVNFYGPLYLIKAFLPLFKENKESHIVNISSMGAFLPVPGQSIYGASKAALCQLSNCLYAELIGTSIKVTCIMPGAMKTNITANSGISVPKKEVSKNQEKMLLDPNKAAKIIIKVIEKNKANYYLGNDSKVMHILRIIAPKTAIKLIRKALKIEVS